MGKDRVCRTPKAQRGLTLIEILLALIVMILGIVGILALFPPALESAKQSFEYTQGAILAESVADALANAVRLSTHDPASDTWTVTLSHDLQWRGQRMLYSFTLPKFADGMGSGGNASIERHHPGNQGATTKIEDQPAFRLGGDPWTKAQLQYIRDNSDPSDPLDQFAFSFTVKKINTLRHLLGQQKPDGQPYTEADLDALCKLYEFQIHIFRIYGAGTGTMADGEPPKRWITTMTTRVSTK